MTHRRTEKTLGVFPDSHVHGSICNFLASGTSCERLVEDSVLLESVDFVSKKPPAIELQAYVFHGDKHVL